MSTELIRKIYGFATVFTVAILFMACKDRYKRVGEEAEVNIYPQGVAEDFSVTYTEIKEGLSQQDSSNSKKVFVLRSPLNQDFENLKFKHQLFPKGVEVDFFDDQGRKSTVVADYGIIYSETNLIDLQGNVVVTSHDGKKLETPQLYWDRANKWIFTEQSFVFTDPKEGTVMHGIGMDLNNENTKLSAHKTNGLMAIKEEEK